MRRATTTSFGVLACTVLLAGLLAQPAAAEHARPVAAEGEASTTVETRTSTFGIRGELTEPWVGDDWVRFRGFSWRFSFELGTGLISGAGSRFQNYSGGLAARARMEFWPIYSPYFGVSIFADGAASGFGLPLILVNLGVWGLEGDVGASLVAGSPIIAAYGEFSLGGRRGGVTVASPLFDQVDSAFRFSYMRAVGGIRLHLSENDGIDVHALFEWPDSTMTRAPQYGGAVHYWMHNGLRATFELFPNYDGAVYFAILLSKTIDWFGPPV